MRGRMMPPGSAAAYYYRAVRPQRSSRAAADQRALPALRESGSGRSANNRRRRRYGRESYQAEAQSLWFDYRATCRNESVVRNGDHPKQDVHRRSLNVPPCFPPGHCARSQPEQTRRVRLRQIKLIADRPDLVGRKQAVLPAIDRDRVFAQPLRVTRPRRTWGSASGQRTERQSPRR